MDDKILSEFISWQLLKLANRVHKQLIRYITNAQLCTTEWLRHTLGTLLRVRLKVHTLLQNLPCNDHICEAEVH
jgi:hypothetical protein